MRKNILKQIHSRARTVTQGSRAFLSVTGSRLPNAEQDEKQATVAVIRQLCVNCSSLWLLWPVLTYRPHPYVCVFRCRPGFIGPLCQHLDPCLRSQCQNGAACKSEVLNGVTQYTCVCQRGFRGMSKRMHMYWKRQILLSKFKVSNWFLFTIWFPGQDCSLIDACATSPCANGARCVNWNNHYNCSCPPGFQGKNCRNDIDECRKPGVCLNGGTCINIHGSFRCQCQPGYSGRTCEVSTLPCAPSQCLNGGTCRQTSDHSYECACLPGRISL